MGVRRPGAVAPLLLALALGGCGRERAVKIAVAGPMTGDQAKAGLDLAQAVELAVVEARARQAGPAGLALEVERADDQSNPTQAASVARKLVSDRSVVAVVGHYNSSCSQPASAIYRAAGMLQISPASTHPALSRQGFETFHRTCATDDLQGPRAAAFALSSLGAKRIFVVDDKTTYGVGLADEFERAATSGGAEVARESIARGDKEFSALLTKSRTRRPDLYFFSMIYPEAALLTRQARRAGIASSLMGGDGVFDPTFIELAGPDSAEGFHVTMEGGDITRIPSAAAFVAAYRARFAMPPGPFSAYAYDAANVALAALAGAGRADRASVLAYVRGRRRYEGATGEIEFDERGDNTRSTFSVYVVQGGRWRYVGEARP